MNKETAQILTKAINIIVEENEKLKHENKTVQELRKEVQLKQDALYALRAQNEKYTKIIEKYNEIELLFSNIQPRSNLHDIFADLQTIIERK